VNVGVSAIAGQAMMSPESFLRAQATEQPRPIYPPSLAAKGIDGVVVASVVFDSDGRSRSVVVLEAPHALMADAVRAAIATWKVRAPSLARGGPPQAMTAKLTFYFRVTKAVGAVLYPEEMPGGERLAAPATVPRGGTPPTGAPRVHVLEGADAPEAIDIGRLTQLLSSGRAALLDVRDRDAFRRVHRDGAVNIPLDELSIRAPIELRAFSHVIVDCSQGDESRCRLAGHFLGARDLRVSMLVP
jgi:TonB family protein